MAEGYDDRHRPDCHVMLGGFFCSCDLRTRREAAQEPLRQKAREETEKRWAIERAAWAQEKRVERVRRFFFVKTPVNAVFFLGFWYAWWLALPVLALYLFFGSVAWFVTVEGLPTESGNPYYKGGLGWLRFFVLW